MDYFCRECGFKFSGKFCPKCGQELDRTLLNSLEDSLNEEYYEPKQVDEASEGYWTKQNRIAVMIAIPILLIIHTGSIFESREFAAWALIILYIVFGITLKSYFKWSKKCRQFESHNKTLICRMREAGKYANAYAMKVNDYRPSNIEYAQESVAGYIPTYTTLTNGDNVSPGVPKEKTIEYQLERIDRMTDGFSFERYMGELLKKIGYKNVQVTKSSGDYGADIVAEKDGRKYSIQCKCFSSGHNVGFDAAKEAVAGANYYKCDASIVVTNQYFTNNAKNYAQASNVSLWDRDALILVLETAGYVHAGSDLNTQSHQTVKVVNQTMQPNKSIELTPGFYVFDEDLPAGKYDFRILTGKGHINIKNDMGETVIYRRISALNEYDDDTDTYRNVQCRPGDVLEVDCKKLYITPSTHNYYMHDRI